MLDDREFPSLHGRLIGVVLEYWGRESLFEKNDHVIREKLAETLSSKLNFETKINWNLSPELIDKQMVAGSMAYLDENRIARVMTFTITATEALAKEYEEKN